MTADPLRRSPLDGFVLELPGLRVTGRPFRSAVNLRTNPANAAVAEVLGVAPPTEPNTVASAGTWSVLWLGPDEWLVIGPDGKAPELVGWMRVALAGQRGSAVDVSANRTTIEVGGEHARDLLEKGCALDLHPRAFQPGRCAQTLLAKAQVVLWQPGVDTYELLVRGSFAGYLAAWLSDAAREYATQEYAL